MPALQHHTLEFDGAAAPGGLAARVREAMQALNAMLLETRNVTLALESWCGGAITVRTLPLPAPAPRPDAALRARLEAAGDEPLVYRLVELVCDGVAVARADNWYAPARLPPEVQARLAAGGLGFGRAVLPLDPARRTLSVSQLWSAPTTLEFLAPGVALFRHQAHVIDGAGRVLSEVNETCLSDALIAGFAKA